METTTAKNKTLVKISKQLAELVIEKFGTAAIGVASDGTFSTYQYRLDELQSLHYSRQADKFIKGVMIASSSFRQTDSRTSTSYFIDTDGMVHSSDKNYSIIFGNGPSTFEEFDKRWNKEAPRYAHANRVI